MGIRKLTLCSEDRYFDIFIEIAKDTDDEEELLFRVTAWNRGPEPAPLHIIPHVWFRNTWSWGHEPPENTPVVRKEDDYTLKSKHYKLGERFLQCSPSPGVAAGSNDVLPELIFTENDTNFKKLYNGQNKSPYVKDAFHAYIVDNEKWAVNPACEGTKAAAWYAFEEGDGVPPGGCAVVRFKFSRNVEEGGIDEEYFDDMIELRKSEADDFYWKISPLPMADDLRNVQRQALSGMLWTKQYYHFVWDQWANGGYNRLWSNTDVLLIIFSSI